MAHRQAKRIEKLEMAADDEAGEDNFLEEEPQNREEVINIRNALTWKRKHFFVMCIFVTIFLMIKLEFSYKKIFS